MNAEEMFTRMIDASNLRRVRSEVKGVGRKYLILDADSKHVGEWFFDFAGNFITAKAT
jgi:hypothetical protein